MLRKTFLLGSSAVLAAGALAMAAPASADGASADAAGAAPAAAAPTGKAAVTKTFTAVRSAPASDAAAAQVITCTQVTQNPHKSTHVPGTVNVVTVLTCTAPVPQINIRAALYRGGALVRDSGQKSVYNSRTAQHNAAVTCVNGTYQGWGSTGILFPPGYVPPTGTTSDWGNAVSITC
jgi:hypothetical protein